tara:strand:+ start:312 stop:686 length:375 start_codon:yes stop_codon:yes gene_type:complete
METTLEALKEASVRFKANGIPIIRMGLHTDKSMLENYVAGPFHPSLKYWIDCRIRLDEMTAKLRLLKVIPRRVRFFVPSRRLSVYKGYRLENIHRLKSDFALDEIIVEPVGYLNKIELDLDHIP